MSDVTEAQGRAIDLGYVIGQKREQMGLSVDEVADSIHLRRAHIRAMESGLFHELPGEAYIRGYLKRYVDFLKLDGDKILGEYTETIEPEARKLGLPEIFSEETHASLPLAFAGVLMAVLCAMLWSAAYPKSTATLVLPFNEALVVNDAPLSHRCEASAAAYPPCSWENIRLWYQPRKPNHHLFTPIYDPAP